MKLRLSENAKVFLAVSGIVALASLTVMGGTSKKEGHDLVSSEKPAAMRRESERTLEGEKAKLRALEEQRKGKALSN